MSLALANNTAVAEIQNNGRLLYANIEEIQESSNEKIERMVYLIQNMRGAIAATTGVDFSRVTEGFTGEHQKRVAQKCKEIAPHLNIKGRELEVLLLAGLVHDAGKFGKEESIFKNQELALIKDSSDIQWKLAKLHAEKSRATCIELRGEIQHTFGLDIEEARLLEEVVGAHHKNFDETGYGIVAESERGKKLADIVQASDAYTAMTESERKYTERPAKTEAQAQVELQRCSGTQFNPEVVEAFIKHQRNALVLHNIIHLPSQFYQQSSFRR